MGADVEEAAARDLRRPHIAHRGTKVVQISVVIRLQFAPSVVSVVEVVKEKNVAQRAESAQRWIRLK
jgi:hypothetical protein